MTVQGRGVAAERAGPAFAEEGRVAVDFYKAAFGAVEVYRFGGTDGLEEVVPQLAVGSVLFWVG